MRRDGRCRASSHPLLLHAQHVKQLEGRKTDVADSVRLARVCQFGHWLDGESPVCLDCAGAV